MKNAYFQLVSMTGGFGLRIVPADGGEGIRIQEVLNYLDKEKIPYVLEDVKKAVASSKETELLLGSETCPAVSETYVLSIAPDNMSVTARFIPASQTGERLSSKEFINDMQYRQVRYGILTDVLEKHFNGSGIYCSDLTIAVGKPPRHGSDAKIEYFFNTDLHPQPVQNEDGSVDYFQLNLVNACKEGQLLARVIPADPGELGMTVQGARIKPRDVKRVNLQYGNHIRISEDRLEIYSEVTGHVALVDQKVFVSDVYTVNNVDNSTGDIIFDGSVEVNGNVSANFTIRATGNVNVKGVVEGACIEAGGDIIISRGMNGMGKGVLRAGRNIAAKFLENCYVEAEGYVCTESILHSNVSAGMYVQVTGKKGFITGGHVQAQQRVEVRTLGATMGAATVVEVGVDPKQKARFIQLQKEVAEIFKLIKNNQPVVTNFTQKKAAGARFSEEQLNYVKQVATLLNVKKQELQEKSEEMQALQETFEKNQDAEVCVTGEVYPGTTIVIGDVSMNIQSCYKYCKFVKQEGEVHMKPL